LVALALLWSATAAAATPAPKDYMKHYHEAKKDGMPLVFLISMNNCPPCREIEQDAVYGEPMLRKTPHFLKLKWEKYPALITRLTGKRNNITPQLLVYRYRKEKWSRWKYVGAPAIRTFVKKEVHPHYHKKK
jgi:hypothetical protein